MDRKTIEREREKRKSVKENLHRAALEKKIIITSLLNGTSDFVNHFSPLSVRRPACSALHFS